jgi:hypothetical protein
MVALADTYLTVTQARTSWKKHELKPEAKPGLHGINGENLPHGGHFDLSLFVQQGLGNADGNRDPNNPTL